MVGYFNPRSPDGERHLHVGARLHATSISIHAPRMGSDTDTIGNTLGHMIFQSTLPGWGATRRSSLLPTIPRNFNPRSPDGERLRHGEHVGAYERISIHAPRMGSDSTATWSIRPDTYFNPRSPDGERRRNRVPAARHNAISIHAPRMGSDCSPGAIVVAMSEFQSTLPGWGATQAGPDRAGLRIISIHAPRMGSDVGNADMASHHITYFNPRSPDGERLHSSMHGYLPNYFNPRSPDGERLHLIVDFRHCVSISIHAPRMGSDAMARAR